MKKYISIGIILAFLCGSLAGCANSDNTAETSSANTSGAVQSNTAPSAGIVDSDSSAEPVKVDFSSTDSDMFTKRDLKADYDEKSSIAIQLNGASAAASSDSVQISGSRITITEEATYIISGSLDDGMIIVNAPDTAKLQIVLKGVNINCESSAPLYILEADKVFVTLADGTENTLSNGGTFTAIDENKIDAAIFSKQDLTINGTGALTVTSPEGHGIVSKDDLVITGGSLTVNSSSHGLDANDSIRLTGDTSLTVNAGKDGLHAENNNDSSKGFVYISDGSVKIEAEGDGISAGAYMQIEGGKLDILAGGGSENGTKSSSDFYGGFMGGRFGGRDKYSSPEATAADDGTSMKGIKAVGSILISNGTLAVNSADDAIHSNTSVTVNGGTFELASGDDGIHADENLTITAGNINITESYEGLEALSINISGGDINLTATDDGINAAGGTDSSGITGGRDGMFGGKGRMSSSGGSMVLSGGNIYIKMGGDGLDANGSMSVTGGNITISGANSGDTSILDYDSIGVIEGGTFIGTGSSSMAQNFGSASTQGSIMVTTGTQSAGTEIKLSDSNENVLVSYTADRDFSCVIISHPSIVNGGKYVLTAGSFSSDITMDGTIYGSGGFGGMGGSKGNGFGGNKYDKQNGIDGNKTSGKDRRAFGSENAAAGNTV
ncbi:MAG: carbohydrate-binding domain-containing protein [Ruminococcus sp.]|nr:carbohydrate-binding domain-containing protein [Ruminococcus sp.]